MLTVTPLIPGRQYATARIAYVLDHQRRHQAGRQRTYLSNNTISWQFRYEPVSGTYLPLTAQRVMESLTDQMRAVQDLIPR